MAIDFTTDTGKRALERLQNESIIWLTTTGSDGMPQPRPVWFAWADGKVYVFTFPGSAKVRHIERLGKTAVSFNTDAQGGDVVVFTGESTVLGQGAAPESARQAYAAKYGQFIPQMMNITVEQFFQNEVAIEFTPRKLRAGMGG